MHSITILSKNVAIIFSILLIIIVAVGGMMKGSNGKMSPSSYITALVIVFPILYIVMQI